MLPELTEVNMGAEKGLRYGDAAALAWLCVFGDTAVGSAAPFNATKLHPRCLERVLTGVCDSDVSKAPSSVEQLVAAWRLLLATMPSEQRELFQLTDADLVATGAPADTHCTAVAAAARIFVSDLRGDNGCYDDCATLELHLFPRFDDAARLDPDGPFTKTWATIAAFASHNVEGFDVDDADAAAGHMAEAVLATAWPRGLNPWHNSSRALRASLTLRFSTQWRSVKLFAAIELHLLHLLRFLPALSAVLIQNGLLVLGRASSLDALAAAVSDLRAESSQAPEETLSLVSLTRLDLAWQRHLPLLNSAELLAMAPPQRMVTLADLRTASNLAAANAGGALHAALASPGAPAGASAIATAGVPLRYRPQLTATLSSQEYHDLAEQLSRVVSLGGPDMPMNLIEIAATGGTELVSLPPPPHP
jgi:hypothetical protein